MGRGDKNRQLIREYSVSTTVHAFRSHRRRPPQSASGSAAMLRTLRIAWHRLCIYTYSKLVYLMETQWQCNQTMQINNTIIILAETILSISDFISICFNFTCPFLNDISKIAQSENRTNMEVNLVNHLQDYRPFQHDDLSIEILPREREAR